MSTAAAFAATPKNWLAQVSAANTNRDGTGTIVDVVTAGANGSRVEAIEITAVGTTTAGVVRLFLYDGANTRLLEEVLVSAITPSATVKVFRATVALAWPVFAPGWKLRAATHNAETFNLSAFGGDF